MAEPSGGSMQESVLLNLLTQRPERKDTRVFAHAAAETQTVIRDTHASSRPVTRAGQVTYQTQEPGFLEVFPRVASRPPKLLQELEAMLVDRLRSNDKAASPSLLVAKDRDPRMAANLSLEAHRQVFGSFVTGFSTYTSLLSRVQAEFDRALAEGVRCAGENVALRERLAEEKARRRKAESEVRTATMAGELEYRRAAFARMQELQERMQRAVKRAGAVERELADVRAEEARVAARVRALQAAQASLLAIERTEQDWSSQPTSSQLSQLKIGPLTAQDEAWLEQEYTSGLSMDGGGEQPPLPSTSAPAASVASPTGLAQRAGSIPGGSGSAWGGEASHTEGGPPLSPSTSGWAASTGGGAAEAEQGHGGGAPGSGGPEAG